MSRKSKLNAIKHGLFSEMIILPGEDPEEFDALYLALSDEWSPDGPTQEDRVLNIAKNLWRKRRLSRLRADYARSLQKRELWVEKQDIDILEKFSNEVRAGKPKLEIKMSSGWRDIFLKYNPRKENESDEDWLKRLADVADGLRALLTEKRGDQAEFIVQALFSDEKAIARDLALEERIDAKIDKDILSLGRMKTMQEMGLGDRFRAMANLHADGRPLKKIQSPSIEDGEPVQ